MNSLNTIKCAFLAAAILPLANCAMHNKFDPLEKPVPINAEFMEMPGGATKKISLNLSPDRADYTVGAGDRVEIEVVEIPETRAVTLVMPDGMLYYDVADGIKADGMTLRKLEDVLAKQLADSYPYAVVSATVVQSQSRNFTVLGQVMSPGSYPIEKPTRLLDAIAMAGGQQATLDDETAELADLGRSVLVRGGSIMPVDFRELVEEGNMGHNVYVKAGDYIFLPPGGREKVYVLGAVNEPTTVPYSSRTSLVHALAAAKGLKPNAFGVGALVIRGSFHDPKVARINLKSVLKGRMINFPLQAGDIVWVPKRPWHKLETYLKEGITAAASSYALRESSEVYFDEDDFLPSQTSANAASSALFPQQ